MIQKFNCPAEGIRAGACQKTGERNREKNASCEDAVYIVQEPDFCFYGLADGQSGKRFGAAGGRRSLEVLASLIRRQGIGGLNAYPFPDELPCMLMRVIRGGILELMERQGGGFSEYASTLLAVAIDPETGEYVLVHIGDGCALGVRQEELLILSAPETGITVNHTWLTTSENAVRHLRLTGGSLRHIRRLALMTDGAACLCRGKNIPRQAARKLTGDGEEILQYLEGREFQDDASCILIDLCI